MCVLRLSCPSSLLERWLGDPSRGHDVALLLDAEGSFLNIPGR